MKQVVISLAVIMISAGILAGMVLYTVTVMRDMETRILTGAVCDLEDTGQECVKPLVPR